jgi:hypothetical protein
MRSRVNVVVEETSESARERPPPHPSIPAPNERQVAKHPFYRPASFPESDDLPDEKACSDGTRFVRKRFGMRATTRSSTTTSK